MGPISVKFGAVDNIAAEIQSSVAKLESRLASYEQDMLGLGEWEGDAKLAFEAAKKEWTAAISDLKMLLARTGGAVQQAASDYQQVEAKNAGLFQ
jgi:early secretory antigenic target protein ESAT-6